MTTDAAHEIAEDGWVHHYVSTACLHEINDGDPDQHDRCRATCKTCGRPCGCANHADGEISSSPPPWVDQARDVARELLAAIGEFDRRQVLTPAQWEQIQTDPRLFWLRGEEAGPGTWTPPEERP
jgi:hypothetical protein